MSKDGETQAEDWPRKRQISTGPAAVDSVTLSAPGCRWHSGGPSPPQLAPAAWDEQVWCISARDLHQPNASRQAMLSAAMLQAQAACPPA